MASRKLDLLPNALDSLAEALAKFEAGDGGDQKAYKFAVLQKRALASDWYQVTKFRCCACQR